VPQTPEDVFNGPPPDDLGGFGSDEPVERRDLPQRGVITFGPRDFIHNSMEHWEQYDWTNFTAKRPGRYRVRLTYTTARSSLPVQIRVGEQRLKKTLRVARDVKQVTLGAISIDQAGDLPFAMVCPATGGGPGLEIRELAFIPVSESEEPIQQEQDGRQVLHANSATTWSETMRYEPKEEKNCLGFWTDPEDFAEWEFLLTQPGRYKVTVVQGCGAEQGGSLVEVRLGSQKLEFTVEDTGGFQNWKEVEAGVLTIREPGLHRLVIDPVDKKGKAVMDIQKVVLTPVS